MAGTMNAAVITKISGISAILEMMRANQAGVAPQEMMGANQAEVSPVEANLAEAVPGVSLVETDNCTINSTVLMDTTIEKAGTNSVEINTTNSVSTISDDRIGQTGKTSEGKIHGRTGTKSTSITTGMKTDTI